MKRLPLDRLLTAALAMLQNNEQWDCEPETILPPPYDAAGHARNESVRVYAELKAALRAAAPFMFEGDQG